MKKKLITLILCGVIGGISVAGVANYKMSQGTEETQTLVNALDSADKKENKNEKEKIDKNNIETDSKKLDKGTSTKESGQANQKSKGNTKVEEDKALNSSNDGKKVQSNSGQGVVTAPPSQSETNNSTNNSWEGTINDGSNSNENNQGSTDGGNSNSGSSNGGTANGGNSNSGSSNGGTSNGGRTNTPAEDTTGNFYDQVEQLIFNKVNEERAKAGVPALSYNSTMETYARIKSKDMGVRNYFDHVNPEGELITAQMARDGVSYNAWGENIAYIGGVSDPTELANQFMTNWMNSQGHRENILSTNFTSIGVGVYKSGNKYYATQEFYK